MATKTPLISYKEHNTHNTNLTDSVSIAPDSWHQAVIDYTDTLTLEQQRAFKAPATVEQCLKILTDNRTRKKAFTRILDLVKPIIEPLKRFEGAIDVVVQVNAGIASPIWGPLRMAITIASEHFKTLERLTFIIDKVARSIQRFQDFEKLFASHQGVRHAVGALYCDLIDLCTRVVRFYTKSFRYFLVSFDSEFASVFDSINLHISEVDQFALAAHIKETAETREKDSAEKQAQCLHQLQLWLSPSTVEDDLHSHRAEYMTGSFDWVIGSDDFNAWSNEPASSWLQFIGPPGSGKSTLAAFLIQQIAKVSSAHVLYFFCNSNDTEKRESIFVLRTLLAQLLKVDPKLASHILPIYQQSGRVLADSRTLVSEAFETAMAERQGIPVYVVIDGIDECSDASDSQALLYQFQSCSKYANIKLLLTRRDSLPNWWGTNWSPTHDLSMRPDLASPYIYEYLKERVKRMPAIANSDIKTEVVTSISESSDGLWLYAKLVADEVGRAPSKERVKKRLASLPHGLFELYSQIVRSCESQMTDDQRQFAQALYLWLDINDYLPDFLANRFDCLRYDNLKHIFCFVNGNSEVFDTAALAQELGAPLLQVRQMNSTYELDFVHRSVYQYLARCADLEYSVLPRILRPQRLKQLYRGVTAVWYFTESADFAQRLTRLRDISSSKELINSDLIGPYLEMTYALWDAFKFDLAKRPDQDEIEEIENLIRRLTHFVQSGEALRWFEMSTIINYSGNHIQLLDNIMEVLQETEYSNLDAFPSSKIFYHQVRSLFLDWAYVIQETTPWQPYRRNRRDRMKVQESSKFDEKEIPGRMMSIAKQWGDISFKDTEELKAQGAFHQPSGLYVCNYCSSVISTPGRKKHMMFSCYR